MRKLLVLALFGLLSYTWADVQPLKVRELYNKDMSFSDLARKHEGHEISVYGFMAPPLKTESTFFVLTKQPMSVCPFCETDADWPGDILAIYGKKTIRSIAYNVPIITTGILELGSYTDPELGFVSQVRLLEAEYKRK